MKPRVLVSAPYAMPVLGWYREQLEAAGCEMVVADVQERLGEDELLRYLGDIDGLICGDDRVTAAVLGASARLKVISKWGTGIDSIDVEAAAHLGVVVRNTPNAFSEPVADSVFSYLLQFARRTEEMTRAVRAGVWAKPQLAALNEGVLGVIGVGNCGRAVVRRAHAFGMKILGCDISPTAGVWAAANGVVMVGLEDLLDQADYVTLHTTLNPTSRHLINARTLALMKPGAFLVNTCRGPVVDEVALVEALQTKHLGGAALDVFEVEPLPAGSPLRGFDNCWLAPHNANSSLASAWRVHENTVRNLLDVLMGPARSPRLSEASK